MSDAPICQTPLFAARGLLKEFQRSILSKNMIYYLIFLLRVLAILTVHTARYILSDHCAVDQFKKKKRNT